MYQIKLNQREARLLRENLTGNREGYDYTDLCRMDPIAKQLTELQGAFGQRMAELTRLERQAVRQINRPKSPEDTEKGNQSLLDIRYEVEDLNEAAEAVQAELLVSDTDHALIVSKLTEVERWMGNDEIRRCIIGMVEAVKNAEHEPDAPPAKKERNLKAV